MLACEIQDVMLSCRWCVAMFKTLVMLHWRLSCNFKTLFAMFNKLVMLGCGCFLVMFKTLVMQGTAKFN